ncbi:sulfatase family protein [Telluribacter sp.]|jgi:arylsulfatase A-like enzyme|uniref:sulfatase family protein n=1 Tax=Telluribacter sp. TaxID=1978767 RepID=UPI002E0F25D7|nr:sulfatase-like hydrolase/transferase [Telluribacter sp.]
MHRTLCFRLSVLIGLLAILFGSLKAQPETRPNIILIFVDDLGYGDVGCYGSKLTPTPHIDKLAAAGVRCTDGYASAATCAPSRLGLMAGRYQQRMGAYSNTTAPQAIIPKDHLFLPQMLKKAGYRTAHIGKWHINRPAKSVFDDVFNELKGAADYFPGPEGQFPGHLGSPMVHGWSSKKNMPYLTDLHGDAAVKFIKEQSEQPQPFFLYLAFNAPHAPWQAPLELKNKFKHISPEVMQLYAAMVHSLDQNVGKVLRQLEKSGVADNTMVLFISDNGPEWGRNYPAFNWPESWPSTIVGSAGPLSGRKAEFLEGGIRVPFIIRWPGKIEANRVYTRPVNTLDLYETFRVAANAPETKSDGTDLLPFLTGRKKEDPHKILFWQGGESRPVYARMGDWKIVAPLDHTPPTLFDLRKDIGEKTDIASQHPGIVKEMLGLVEKWKQEIKQVN